MGNKGAGELNTSVEQSMQPLLRAPIETCDDMCGGFYEVPKLADVDPIEFEREFLERNRPAVITDAIAKQNWSAMHQFTFDYFRQLFAGYESATCQFFPYKTEFKSVDEFFTMNQSRFQLPWYVGW